MYYKLMLLDSQENICLDQFNLRLPSVVGRSPEAGVFLNDPSISRQHCRFHINAHGALAVQDLGSTNGIYIRDARVKQATVMVGEVFQIGGLTVKVEMIEQPLDENSQNEHSTADSMYGTQKVEIFEIS